MNNALRTWKRAYRALDFGMHVQLDGSVKELEGEEEKQDFCPEYRKGTAEEEDISFS